MNGWRAFAMHLTFYGIAIFAGYLIAAFLCYRAAREWTAHPSRRRSGVQTMRRERTIWNCLCAILLAIAIYRQLDAADLVGDTGRSIARAGAVYDIRRPFQAAVAVGAIIVALGAMLATIVTFRRVNPLALAAAGCAFLLVALLVVTTISLHQIDAIMRVGIGGASFHNVVEIGSVAALASFAWPYCRQSHIVRRR